MPVSELDVETEIYERLYGSSRREQRNGHPPEQPIVIDDRDLRPAGGDLEALAVPHPPVRRARTVPVDLGGLARGAGELLAAALAAARTTARGALADLRPAAGAVLAAARRHPAPASALVWAVIAAPVLVLALLSGGGRAATLRLHPSSPHFTIPSTLSPSPARHHAARRAAPPPVTTTESTPPPAASATTRFPRTTATPRRKSTSPARRHTATSRPHRRTASTPHRTPPLRRPSPHEAPAHKPASGVQPSTPTTSTPTTPSVTGGQPAPTG